MKETIHRDPVHGDVRFDPLSTALLDTAALQRLGRVYQLGFAHLVYRGGTHTRLSHVMGTAHLAGRLVDRLRLNQVSDERPEGAVPSEEFLPGDPGDASMEARWDVLRHLVQWAALLHDIGHVPHGHTLEDEFDALYERHDALRSPRLPVLWWETPNGRPSEIRAVFSQPGLLPPSFNSLGITGHAAWQAVVMTCLYHPADSDGARLSFADELAALSPSPFSTAVRAAFAECCARRRFFPYMADLVANTIGADFLDYVRRDPSFVGLDVLSDDRVTSRFYVGRDRTTNDLRLALSLVDRRGKPRLDTCTGVVELVRRRFRFAEVIYYHKTKVAAAAMLAKVFALIGVPPDVGAGTEQVDIDGIEEMADEVLRAGAGPLRDRCVPTALLDPEIGDESLLLWLQEHAWVRLSAAAESRDRGAIVDGLQGLSLLQALVRRQLYKVALAIDADVYARLSPSSRSPAEVENEIDATLIRLRSDPPARARLERMMAAAASVTPGSFLLYVPPRKSQAKGIDTGALSPSGVITLGSHPAVRDDVRRLNDAYRKLWRMLVFVHPKHVTNHRALSSATDALVTALFPAVNIQTAGATLARAAWFTYVGRFERETHTA